MFPVCLYVRAIQTNLQTSPADVAKQYNFIKQENVEKSWTQVLV